MMQKPERSVYTSHDFIAWREGGTLSLTPKFQRRGVWTVAARSFFIDSLLRTMPVPPIYIRNVQNAEKNRVVHEIIDGQQRVSCVLDFIDGKFRLAGTIPATWAGKTFNALSAGEQTAIQNYSFSTEIFYGLSDFEVLEIFARLNTYSVPLNAQELRNGRYFGAFKQSAYGLAYEHLEFWRSNKIFAERGIARMLEVELTSELMIAEISGMQDKKKTIDIYYKNFDEEFERRATTERKFRLVIDNINESIQDGLSETEFSRSPLFYTLFCALFHQQFGLPNSDLPTPKKAPTKDQRISLSEAVHFLSEPIALGRAGEPVPDRYAPFVAACLRQTDNMKPRQERLKTLYERAFG